tara:strand:- start:691 stop:846 length:156 start_codon:yes stop_codon:yes gene_type:complete
MSARTPEQQAQYDYYRNPDYAYTKPPYKKDTMERARYMNELFKLQMQEQGL